MADAPVLLAGLALGAAIVAGMMLRQNLVTQAAAAGAIAAAVLNPAVGLVTLAFMAPLKTPLVVPAPGFNALLVGGILAGSIYRLPFERPKLSVGAPLMLLLAFVLYVFVQQLPEMVSGYAGKDAHLVSSLFLQLVLCAATVVAGGIVLRGRRPLPFIAALLVSAILASLLAVLSVATTVGPPLANLLEHPGDVRVTGPFGNPNSFGLFLATGIALTAALWVKASRPLVRRGLVATGAVLMAGLALSFSRGGVLAVAAGAVALVFARNRALGIAAAVVGLVLALIIYPAFVDWRLENQTGSASETARLALTDSDEGRLSAVLAGFSLFAASPIFGVGFGHYSMLTVSLAGTTVPIGAHNWYVNVLAEQGAVGIVIWILLMVAVAQWVRTRAEFPRSIGYAVGGTFAVGSMFHEPPTSVQISALALIVITAVLVADWTDDQQGPVAIETRSEIPRAGAMGKEAD
jgi:putative inorganic carbon (HCO3(-)) transporter